MASRRLISSGAEEGGQKKLAEGTVNRESPRVAIPSAVVQVLGHLIDDEGVDPSVRRVELRTLRSRLCRLYGIKDPMGPVNATEIAWENEPDAEIE